MNSIPSSTATFFRNEKLCCLNIMIAAIQHNEPMTSLEGWGIPPCPALCRHTLVCQYYVAAIVVPPLRWISDYRYLATFFFPTMQICPH